MLAPSATMKALGLGWRFELAQANVRASARNRAHDAHNEIKQLAAIARIELRHNVKVI